MEKTFEQRDSTPPLTGFASGLEWGVASSVHPGELESGDLHLVKRFESGILLAVVDGLGHGREAAAVARIAVQTLETFCNESPLSLLQRTHLQLQRTRGAVLTVVSFNTKESALSWLGVGNVEAALLRADPGSNPSRETAPLRGGVVGYQIAQPYASMVPVSPGDLLVMATDGINSPWEVSRADFGLPPQEVAERLFSQHSKMKDDALVLVARFNHGKS